ncbi:MAG: DUF4140 domain-containing protein, partial [Myxococcales bacterium]|nr:DUF4140 domain-containing protein [Polyangiaceae bacterium]MDW8251362.1 DUF4140 domain-containing protein [Myxococcales bacterium]
MIDASLLPRAHILSSKVARVTFFEDRAEVVRQLRCKVPPGSCLAVIAGVTLVIDDSSLVATVKGSQARVVASSVRRAEAQGTGTRTSERMAREGDHLAARKRLFEAHRNLDRAEAEQARLQRLLVDWERSVVRTAHAHTDQIASLRNAYEELSRALEASFSRLE